MTLIEYLNIKLKSLKVSKGESIFFRYTTKEGNDVAVFYDKNTNEVFLSKSVCAKDWRNIRKELDKNIWEK